MKNSLKYQSPLKAIAFIVFISLCWTNVASYHLWLSDGQKISLQNTDPIDGDTEKEEKKVEEEEKDEKRLQNYFNRDFSSAYFTPSSNWQTSNYQALHHPDVATPPPKYSLYPA